MPGGPTIIKTFNEILYTQNPYTKALQDADLLPTAVAYRNGIVSADISSTITKLLTGKYSAKIDCDQNVSDGDEIIVEVSATVAGIMDTIEVLHEPYYQTTGIAGLLYPIILGVTGVGASVASKAEGATMLLGITGIRNDIRQMQSTVLLAISGISAGAVSTTGLAIQSDMLAGITGIRDDIRLMQATVLLSISGISVGVPTNIATQDMLVTGINELVLGITGLKVSVASKAEGATMLLGVTGIRNDIINLQNTMIFGFTGINVGVTRINGIGDLLTVLARNRLEFDLVNSVAYKWNDAGTLRLYVTDITDKDGNPISAGTIGPINMGRWVAVP